MRRPEDPALYYNLYTVQPEPEGKTRDEVEALGMSATHDLVIFSMIHAKDGGLSTLIRGLSHDGTELTPGEYFKAWTLLTKLVADKLNAEAGDEPPREGSRRELVNIVWESIVVGITGGRGGAPDAD